MLVLLKNVLSLSSATAKWTMTSGSLLDLGGPVLCV